MAELGIREPMLVKHIMSSPVITISENESASKAAALMEKHNVGCVIVTTENGRPLGIITERDLVARIVAKDVQPSKVEAKEIMTTPLITVDPEENLKETARRMSRLNIRRLGVMYKGKLVGLVSSKDILAITPELIEIIQERARIENRGAAEEVSERSLLAGYCDNCGQWSDHLSEVEGSFMCVECRIDLGEQ